MSVRKPKVSQVLPSARIIPRIIGVLADLPAISAASPIDRRIGGRWAVSRVALATLLEGDKNALAAYLTGDRSSPRIMHYFCRCGVPLPRFKAAESRASE
jgi:hypothetical protein